MKQLSWRQAFGVAGLLTIIFVGILAYMGQPVICECGYVKLWEGVVQSSGNSQHLSDWYTPSHIIHGFAFYLVLWLLFPKWSVPSRMLAAFGLEAAWELLENSDFIINRYRETTISLDYFGDSVINSVADLWFAMLGFFAASRLPVWASVAFVVVAELFVGYAIRDNLTLNIIMLLYPLESIKAWQSAI